MHYNRSTKTYPRCMIKIPKKYRQNQFIQNKKTYVLKLYLSSAGFNRINLACS